VLIFANFYQSHQKYLISLRRNTHFSTMDPTDLENSPNSPNAPNSPRSNAPEVGEPLGDKVVVPGSKETPGIPPSQGRSLASKKLNVRSAETRKSDSAELASPAVPSETVARSEDSTRNTVKQLEELKESAPQTRGFWETLIRCLTSFVGWDQAAASLEQEKINEATKNYLRDHNDEVNNISDAVSENIANLDPELVEIYTHTLTAMDENGKTNYMEQFQNSIRENLERMLSQPGDNTGKNGDAERLLKNATAVLTSLGSQELDPAKNKVLCAIEKFKGENPHIQVSMGMLRAEHKHPGLIMGLNTALTGNGCAPLKRIGIQINKPVIEFPQNLADGMELLINSELKNDLSKIFCIAQMVALCPSMQITPQLIDLCIATEQGILSEVVVFAVDHPGRVQITPELIELRSKDPDAFNRLKQLAQIRPGIEITPQLINLCIATEQGILSEVVVFAVDHPGRVPIIPELIELRSKDPDAFNRLKQLAQIHPGIEITPAIVTLIKTKPELVDKIIKNGTIDFTWQSFTDKGYCSGENCRGLLLEYECANSLDNGLIRSVVNELFSKDNTKVNAAVNCLLDQAGPLKQHYFVLDGIYRSSIPDIHLPKGVHVISNRNGGEEYLAATKAQAKEAQAGEYDRTEYLKYLVGQFEQAYGDKAADAFYVYLQNFTGAPNLTTIESYSVPDIEGANRNLFGESGTLNNVMGCGSRRVTMTMDESFNATYDITRDASYDVVHSHGKIRNDPGALALKAIPSYNENTVMVMAVRSFIPAAHNPAATDPWDQRGQNGKQETHCSFIVSHGTPAARSQDPRPSAA
jgi:hypothetical protein